MNNAKTGMGALRQLLLDVDAIYVQSGISQKKLSEIYPIEFKKYCEWFEDIEQKILAEYPYDEIRKSGEKVLNQQRALLSAWRVRQAKENLFGPTSPTKDPARPDLKPKRKSTVDLPNEAHEFKPPTK